MKSIRDWFRAALQAPCDPLPPPDPYKGVVGGPELVERTRWTHAQHEARYRDDGGFPISEWGPFDPDQLGCQYVPERYNAEAP